MYIPYKHTPPAPIVRQKTTRAECSGVGRSGIQHENGKNDEGTEDARSDGVSRFFYAGGDAEGDAGGGGGEEEGGEGGYDVAVDDEAGGGAGGGGGGGGGDGGEGDEAK